MVSTELLGEGTHSSWLCFATLYDRKHHEPTMRVSVLVRSAHRPEVAVNVHLKNLEENREIDITLGGS